MIGINDLIIAQEHYYEMDGYKTKVNNNVLVVGTSGSGKTRHIVGPNIEQAVGSYVISDPKGNLYRKYKDYLEARGYEVKKLDFVNPSTSVKYNPVEYIRKEHDILKLGKILTSIGGGGYKMDPFWNQSAELLFTACIAFLKEGVCEEDKNLTSLQKLIVNCEIDEDDSSQKNVLDRIMLEHSEMNPDSFAVKQYNKFRLASGRTLKSILISAMAKIGALDTDEVAKMIKVDEVDIASIGQKKTAVFVIVSDTDRSMDILANIFFTQAMQVLCRYADEECTYNENRLPIDVRFILDDFATNVLIEEFPRMISSIRSRGISTMLLIQSEGQLRNYYGEDNKTIIGNCDTYVYLGGNDIDSAQEVARRCDIPLRKVLNMEIGYCWIFRRGEVPQYAKLLDLEEYQKGKLREASMVGDKLPLFKYKFENVSNKQIQK